MSLRSDLAGVLLVLGLSGTSIAADAPAHVCHAGAYRLDSGDAIVISPSDEDTLRYRLRDGRSGRLYPELDGFYSGAGWAEPEPRIVAARFGDCAEGRLEFRMKNGPSGMARRAPIRKTDTTFQSLGNTLYGELHMPADREPRALVILAYGSGRESATTFNHLQHMLPLYSIATFVFDKRGTGRSQGAFTADFSALADDTTMAVAHARKLLDRPNLPVGILGESQGGWVAPLAASRATVDFVVVSYGLAIGPLDEDREEVMQELRGKGYGADTLAKAGELTQITARVLLSRLTQGLDRLQQFKAAHANEPWLQQVEGDFTGPLVRTPPEGFAELSKQIDYDFILDYDPVPALRRVNAPMLWVVAGKDTEAPSPPTLRVLRAVQSELPSQLDIVVFPNADHGMIETRQQGDELRLLGHSPGYYDLLGEWIVSRSLRSLDGKLGAAERYPDAE